MTFKEVSKAYGVRNRIQAILNVTLQVRGEEFLTLLGPSGCGKTTLLRIAAGLIDHDSGETSLFGEPPSLYRQRHSVGYVSQTPALLPWRTARENARLPGELGPKERRRSSEVMDEKIDRSFSLLGISEYGDLYPEELSGGLKQRVAVARALACDSSIVFMDEPFSALDAITRERLWTDISRIFAVEGATALMVSHHIGEAVAMSDRVLVLSRRPGQVVGEVAIEALRPRSSGFSQSAAAREYETQVRGLLDLGNQ